MTDKELLAHEYAVENWEYYEEGQSDFEALKKAVLYGLEAGRPEWHKVADGDLPPENTEVLNDDGVKVILIHGHWRYFYGAEWEDDACVDHWCKIPQYTEEESE